MGKKKPLAWKI